MSELADMLNTKGLRSGKGSEFRANIVQHIIHAYGLTSKKEKYISLGYLSTKEKAMKLGITTATLIKRVEKGRYQEEVVRVNEKDLMFMP